VAVPPEERPRLDWLNDVTRPEGDVEAPRLILPANPLRLFSVTAAVPDPPRLTTSDVGFRETV